MFSPARPSSDLIHFLRFFFSTFAFYGLFICFSPVQPSRLPPPFFLGKGVVVKLTRWWGGAQASSKVPARGAGGTLVDGGARSLHIQAAKVVTAHAASVGDVLLGVPLLVSAGAILPINYLPINYLQKPYQRTWTLPGRGMSV